MDKISFKNAKKKIESLKAEGKTVGLCHGGFDLVHPGHVKHFESASKLCDVLFVSLTSDKYVRERKGKNRPIYNQKLRSYMISSIKFVDFVTISDFKKAVETIKSLKPNYYIKGPDYRYKRTKGIKRERKAIKSVGGRIRYTDDEKFSTSKLIDRISKIRRKKMLLILDRDGTLIKKESYIGRKNGWKSKIKLNREVVDIIHYLARYFNMTNIVITNQTGVALGYFSEKRVEKINSIINKKISKEGIVIKDWEYCPYADLSYAKDKGIDKFNKGYVKEKSRRKPSRYMLNKALNKLNKKLGDFDKIVFLGDSEDDQKLAEKIKDCKFINVKNKKYSDIKKELSLLTS